MAKYDTIRVPHETPMFDKDGIMSRTWIIFFEKLPKFAAENGIVPRGLKKATFGLVRTLTVENDLTNHFISLTSGRFIGWSVNAKNPPTGAAAILNIEISHDEGSSWHSIFDSIKIEIPDGDNTRIDGTFFTDEIPHQRIQKGDLLRINCEQIGSTFAGKDIEVVVYWA
jgi:hypothetical protein